MFDHHYHFLKNSERKMFRFIPKLRMKLKCKSNNLSDIISNDLSTFFQIESQRQIARDIIEKSKERNKIQLEIAIGVKAMERSDGDPEYIEKWRNSKMEIVNALQQEIECAQRRGQELNKLIMSKC